MANPTKEQIAARKARLQDWQSIDMVTWVVSNKELDAINAPKKDVVAAVTTPWVVQVGQTINRDTWVITDVAPKKPTPKYWEPWYKWEQNLNPITEDQITHKLNNNIPLSPDEIIFQEKLNNEKRLLDREMENKWKMTEWEKQAKLQQEIYRNNQIAKAEELKRSQAAYDAALLPWREDVISSANIGAAQWAQTWIARQRESLEKQWQLYSSQINQKRREYQEAIDSDNMALADSLSKNISNLEANRDKLALKDLEATQDFEKNAIANIKSLFPDMSGLSDEQIDLISEQYWVDAGLLKASRDASKFTSTSEQTRKVQWQILEWVISAWWLASMTMAGATALAPQTWYSAVELMWLWSMYKDAIDNKATREEAQAIVLAEIKSQTTEKEYEKEKYIRKMKEAYKEGRYADARAWWEAAWVDMEEYLDTDSMNSTSNVSPDADMVLKLWEIQEGTTYKDKWDANSWECWRFVNDVTWIPSLMWNTYASKTDDAKMLANWYTRVNSPVAWAIFVTKTDVDWKWTWHTWMVTWTSIWPDGKVLMNVKESNNTWKVNWKWVVWSRTWVDPSLNDAVFYAPTENVDSTLMSGSIKWVPMQFANRIKALVPMQLRNTEKEQDDLALDVRAMNKAWLSADDAALLYMWFHIEDADMKDYAKALVDTAKIVPNAEAFKNLLVKISDKVNKWDKAWAVMLAENAVTPLLKEEYWWGYMPVWQVSYMQEAMNSISRLVDKNDWKLWPIAGRVADLEQVFSDDKDYQALKTLISWELAQVRKLFWGTSITENELEALRDTVWMTTKMQPENLKEAFQTNLDQRYSIMNNQRYQFWLNPLDAKTIWSWEDRAKLYEAPTVAAPTTYTAEDWTVYTTWEPASAASTTVDDTQF